MLTCIQGIEKSAPLIGRDINRDSNLCKLGLNDLGGTGTNVAVYIDLAFESVRIAGFRKKLLRLRRIIRISFHLVGPARDHRIDIAVCYNSTTLNDRINKCLFIQRVIDRLSDSHIFEFLFCRIHTEIFDGRRRLAQQRHIRICLDVRTVCRVNIPY